MQSRRSGIYHRAITLAIVFIMMIVLPGCSSHPYSATNRIYKKQVRQYARILDQYPLEDSFGAAAYFVGTTNFNMRKPNYVIIHHTAQNSCDQTLRTFTLTRTQVSAHYVICKDGTIHHMLNDYLRAWHAGVARWGNLTDVNSSSVGIELDNNGFEPFTEPQINGLLKLLTSLKAAYNIPASNFIGHGDIAPTRKNDPNVLFPWKMLADSGFGNWYDDTTGVVMPFYFDPVLALRIVGYDTKDTSASIVAFKRHWLQDTTSGFTDESKKVLFMLAKKYL